MEMPDKTRNITESRRDSADNDNDDDIQVSNDEFDHGRTYFVERIHIPRDETDDDKVLYKIYFQL